MEVSELEMIKRLWTFLLFVVLVVITLAGVQGSATSASLNGSQVQIIPHAAYRIADEDLLKKYYVLSALPLQDIKASFRKASSSEKSALWRTHLALFLAKRPELNETQKEVIRAAISLATPEYFEMRSTESSWQIKVADPMRSLEKRIVTAFPVADRAKIFATLGDDTESENDNAVSGCGLILFKTIDYKPLGHSSSYEIQRGDCMCSIESDYCAVRKMCRTSNCNPTQNGCGTLWLHPCNGSCQ